MSSYVAAALGAAALVISLAGAAADKSPAAGDAPTESSIVTKIKTEFLKDRTVSASGITVENEDEGIVTLGGRARSKTEADQAIKLARDTSGVISVKNNIVIAENAKDGNRGSGGKAPADTVRDDMKDASITARIKAEFVKDKSVGATAIKVDTDERGVVTLSGNAKSQAEAEKAVKIARNTKGVTSVRNEIAVAR